MNCGLNRRALACWHPAMPMPPHRSLVSAAIVLLMQLALCSAQNAPSPSPETPVSRYLQVMSATARALQKGQPLYDFKARPVAGNGMHTLLQERAAVMSCVAPAADSPACSVVQGLVVMPLVCVAVGVFTALFWFAFVCARKYCKCCCNNCGGRKPQPEGGKYTQRSKIIIAVALFLSSCIIVAISSMAISAAYRAPSLPFTTEFLLSIFVCRYDAPETLARFYRSVLEFLDQATSFLNSASSFILSNGATIAGAISTVQTSFSALQNTLNSSQIDGHTSLLSMTYSLGFISASCANFSASTATFCSNKATSFRSNIASSTSSLTKFQVKSLALNNVADDIAPKLANNTAPTRDAVQTGSEFTASSRKSLLTLQLETANPQGQAQLATLLLFGSLWLLPLCFALAFMCHKWTHWCYCSLLSPLSVFCNAYYQVPATVDQLHRLPRVLGPAGRPLRPQLHPEQYVRLAAH
jgi:hypothetical protein